MNYITAACDLRRSSNIPSTNCRLAEGHNTIYVISHPRFPKLACWSLISNTRHLWWRIVMMNPQLDHTLLKGWTLYINQTYQRNSPQPQYEGNIDDECIRNLTRANHKMSDQHPITNIRDKQPSLLPTDFISSIRQNLHPNFLLQFPNRQEDFPTALASTQET